MDNESRQLQLLSIIVPIYNEEANLKIFFENLLPALEGLGSYEIICVCDGCKDNSLAILLELKAQIKSIKIIDFSRNFGKEAAVLAGLKLAKGDCAIPIDADLQHPPELIKSMLSRWQQGFDMIVAINSNRDTSWIRKLTSAVFYKLFNAISKNALIPHGLDYRLLDRSLVNIIIELPEKNRFFKGLSSWVTNNISTIEFEAKARKFGQSKWSLFSLWRFALDAVTSFSSFPLRIWSYLGAIISSISFIYMLIIIFQKIIWKISISGYASIMVVILFLGGIQLLSLGIIGEYISRIFIETKNRTPYVVKKIYE